MFWPDRQDGTKVPRWLNLLEKEFGKNVQVRIEIVWENSQDFLSWANIEFVLS